MQKQTFFLAASVALVLAMSSVGQAQSYSMGNDVYGQVVWSEQSMIQPASVTPVGVPVSSYQSYAPAPAPRIPFSETQNTTPFVLPAVPVAIASPVQYVAPAEPMLPPVQQMIPVTTMQPVCTSGG